MIYFIGYSLFSLIAFLFLDTGWAFLAVTLSIMISPFIQMRWNDLGGLVVWGWSNPLRYAGSSLLTVVLPWVVLEKGRRRRLLAFGMGVLWGGFCWIAQENLVIGLFGSVMALILMWATNAARLREILHAVLFLGLGGLTFWLPILLFYLSRGRMMEYLSNYFLVGGQVLSGLSNTPPHSNITSVFSRSNILYFAAPLLVWLGLGSLYGTAPRNLPSRWRRLNLIAFVCAALANLFGALSRTDASHLVNTLFLFPITLAIGIRTAPSFFTSRSLRRVGVVLLVLVVMSMLPLRAQDVAGYLASVANRQRRFCTVSDEAVAPLDEAGVVFDRTGYDVIDGAERFREYPAITVGELLLAIDSVQQTVGDHQQVFVHSFPHISPGLIYFLADFRPAPVYLEPVTMVFSGDVYELFLEHFTGIVGSVDCVISAQRDAPEIDLFLAAHPDATVLTRTFAGREYYLVGFFDSE